MGTEFPLGEKRKFRQWMVVLTEEGGLTGRREKDTSVTSLGCGPGSTPGLTQLPSLLDGHLGMRAHALGE